jgi:hypothetical protein
MRFNIRIDDYIWQAEYESALNIAFSQIAIDLYWDNWLSDFGVSL